MSQRYSIDWADGSTEEHDDYAAAVDAVLARYPEAEIGHDGDIPDGGDRTLCWPDEESSVDDDGARVIAAIRAPEGGAS